MLYIRPYQTDCIEAIKGNWAKGHHRQLVSMPTASGKTIVFANMIKTCPGRVLVLVHTHELMQQAKEKIEMVCDNVDVGLVYADQKEFDTQVVISTIQAAGHESTLEQLVKQDFVICITDECHHFAADGARYVLDKLGFGTKVQKNCLLASQQRQ